MRYGIGVDTVDLAECTKRGIYVANVPDYCIEEVATHCSCAHTYRGQERFPSPKRIPAPDTGMSRPLSPCNRLEILSWVFWASGGSRKVSAAWLEE